MSDTLIFDVLLSKGGIRHADSLYPPASVDGLERLLEAICNCTYDAVKQDSLIYFLLKWHQDGREMDFSESRCIQPQFVILADAYWHLDTGINVEVSGLMYLRCLRHPLPLCPCHDTCGVMSAHRPAPTSLL